MKLELHALEVFGRHGALPEEAREGQTFFFDVELDVREVPSDRLHDAVDYREVAAAVREVSDARRYELIEALAAATADTLVERFPIAGVRVRVRKPSPVGVPAEWAAATVGRSTER